MKFLYYLFIFGYFKDNIPKTLLSITGISLGIALFVSTQINSWRAEQSVLDQMIAYSSEKFSGRYVANNQNQGAKDSFLKEIESQIPENIRLEPEFQTKGTITITKDHIQSIPIIGKDILLSSQIMPLPKVGKNKIPKYFISQSLSEKLRTQKTKTNLTICEKEITILEDDYQIIPTEGIFLVMDITRLQSLCYQKKSNYFYMVNSR